ncbi:MAG: hypothetical protein JXR49_00720, partial [Acidobacteria bacterium]|nr:hypothetical protein [Acidobacteriota bacterium]
VAPHQTPPRALSLPRKPHARDLLYFYHGLLTLNNRNILKTALAKGKYSNFRSRWIVDGYNIAKQVGIGT